MADVDFRREFPQAATSFVQENDDLEGRGDAAEAIYAARQAYEQAAAADREQLPTAADDPQRKRRDSLNRALWRGLGIEEEVDAVLAPQRDDLSRMTLGRLLRPGPRYVAPRPPPVDVGVLWRSETSVWTPDNLLGLFAFWDEAAGGAKFVGQLDYDNGNLWRNSAGALARFSLGTDRMPPRGRYVSRPVTDLFGEVWGANGISGPLSFGDNWCKCWLHTTQTLRAPDGSVIVSGHDVRTLLFFEDDGQHGVMPLPGALPFPPVGFDLDPTQPLVAELELKFEFQLEGDPTFRFGNYAGWVPALFRSPNWTITPA